MFMADIVLGSALSGPRIPVENRTKRSSLEENMKAKGLKLFIIEGHEVWAINEKTAKKKIQKIKNFLGSGF
jgi:hypothetical protein